MTFRLLGSGLCLAEFALTVLAVWSPPVCGGAGPNCAMWPAVTDSLLAGLLPAAIVGTAVFTAGRMVDVIAALKG